MSHYKVYFLGPTGHINKARDIECQDDLEVFSKAKEMMHGCSIEIWQQARQVAHIGPERSHTAS